MKNISLIVVALLIGATPLGAQTPRPERPYRGLFGGGVGDTEQLLTLNLSFGAGYDDDVLANDSGSGPDSSQPRDPQHMTGGYFGNLTGGLNYSVSKSRAGLNASAATSLRYYPDVLNETVAGHSGGVGGYLQFGSGTRLSANQMIAYQPLYTLTFLPPLFDPELGQAMVSDHSFGTIKDEHLTYGTTADFSQTLSRRAAVSFYYSDLRSEFSGERGSSFSTRTVGGRFTRELARGLSLRLGYGRSIGTYGDDGERVNTHNADVGVDFNRSLSISRRWTLAFGTGSTAVADRDRTYYRVTGNARLNREIGRTWNAALAYNRGVEFVETLREPVFSDGATLGVSGLVNRKVQFHSSVGAAFGVIGVGGNGTSFDTYQGTAGVTYGLTRHIGLGVDYSYYRYAFDSSAGLRPGVPAQLDRQSVRTYLTLWAPLVQRARRPDASR